MTDIYKKLNCVPLPSLKECLKKYIKDEDQKSKVDKYSKAETINRFRTLSLSDDVIIEIYNQYKLGKNLSFQLFYSNKALNNLDFDIKNWNSSETTTDVSKIKYENLPKIKNLKFTDVEDITNNTLEVSYKYHVLHKYFNDSENEEPSYIYQTQYGFLWINIQNSYVVIIAKEEKVIQIIVRQFQNLFNIDLSQPQLTKAELNKIFLKENTKSATYTEPTGLTTKYSFASTAGDYVQNTQNNIIEDMDEIGTRKANARYKECIITNDMENSSIISVNSDKCKISILKTYSTNQIRAWGQTKFNQITQELNNIKKSDIRQFFNIFNKGILSEFHLSKAEESFVKTISVALYDAIKNNKTCEININNLNYNEIKLSKFFNIITLYDCPNCDSQHYAKCFSCDSELVWKDGLYCNKCGKLHKEKIYLKCEEKDFINEIDVYEVVTLIPNSILITILSKFISQTGLNFNVKLQSFYIKNNILFYKTNISKVELSITDLSLFKDLDINLAIKDNGKYQELKNECLNIQEKCKSCNKTNCASCKGTDSRSCLMKMFSYIIPSYKPQPHKGSEYGDVSFADELNGEQRFIKMIAKKYESSGPALITKGAGREIIIQVITQYLRDSYKPILSILIPSGLDAALKQDINFLIHFIDGKVIYIEEQEFIALYKMAKEKGFTIQ